MSSLCGHHQRVAHSLLKQNSVAQSREGIVVG
jgi:hypothetical protein